MGDLFSSFFSLFDNSVYIIVIGMVMVVGAVLLLRAKRAIKTAIVLAVLAFGLTGFGTGLVRIKDSMGFKYDINGNTVTVGKAGKEISINLMDIDRVEVDREGARATDTVFVDVYVASPTKGEVAIPISMKDIEYTLAIKTLILSRNIELIENGELVNG